MIDIGAAMALAEAAADKQPISQTIHDAQLIYGVIQDIKKAGQLDVLAMYKAGTLKPFVDAARRSIDIIDDLENDPAQAPNVEAVLGSLS